MILNDSFMNDVRTEAVKGDPPAVFARQSAGGLLQLTVHRAGDDVLLLLSGGTVPHIGSVVVASPRPSLTGVGRAATSSVINRSSHYDEIPARRCAESLAKALGIQVVCACGIHTDQADATVINNILAVCDELTRDAKQFLRKNDGNL